MLVAAVVDLEVVEVLMEDQVVGDLVEFLLQKLVKMVLPD